MVSIQFLNINTCSFYLTMRTKLSLSAASALERYWVKCADTYDGVSEFYQTMGWDLQEHETLEPTANNIYDPFIQYHYSLPTNQVTFFLLKYAS